MYTSNVAPNRAGHRRSRRRVITSLMLAAAVLAAASCGSDDAAAPSTPPPPTTAAPVDEAAGTTTPPTTPATTPATTEPPATAESTTTVAPRDDATIAAASLLTGELIGDAQFAPFNNGLDYSAGLAIERQIPECADMYAAEENGWDTATGATSGMVRGGQYVFQTVVLFATEEAAATALVAFASSAGQTCSLTVDRVLAAPPPATGITAELVDVPSPAPHGDQQVSYGSRVSNAGAPMFAKHTVWVQVDRAIVQVTLVNGPTDPDPLGILDTVLGAAVELITTELSAG